MAVDIIARALASGASSDWRETTEEIFINQLLHFEEIDNTVQTIYYNTDGEVDRIEYVQGDTTVRTDAFTFGEGVITEVRTLYTGETLTITTNLETLVTTVVYTE